MNDLVDHLRGWAPLIASGLECPAASTVMFEAADRITALEAENTRLREALVPFAKEADAWWSELPDEARPWIAEPGNVGGADAEFSLHDLRRARAALGDGGGDA